jgi:hypothetical protein
MRSHFPNIGTTPNCARKWAKKQTECRCSGACVTAISLVRSTWKHTSEDNLVLGRALVILLAAGLSGCAHFIIGNNAVGLGHLGT